MDEMKNEKRPERTRPERRRKTKEELFKENTLPYIILGVAALFILTFIIGAIARGVQKGNMEKAASVAASEAANAEEERLAEEAADILKRAAELAENYDFDGAIQEINTFTGNIGAYPDLQDAKISYEYSRSTLIPWKDPSTIINLSFQTLIADPARAFNHDEFGYTMETNYMTVSEFQKILEDLYANNYILVSPRDFVEESVNDDGEVTFVYKEMLLPEGKKPMVLTQTNVNYVLDLTDSDDDMVADQGGAGVASKLILQADGSITNEMVDAQGNTITGSYDLVPILDAFIAQHPDFSYRGAKAVLALTGYNGLFGYRIHPEGKEKFGEDAYNKDVAAVKAIAEALTESGYDLACYSYANMPYGVLSLSEIQSDMVQWNDEILSILGKLDMFVFAQKSDINSGMLYSGEKYDYLKNLGYNYFIGFCTEGESFTYVAEDYVRQGRLLVNFQNISQNPNWFNGLFDVEELADPARES